MKKKILVFLFEGYSDWEIAYLAPEINKSEDYELIYASNNGDSVTSMGGLQVKPNMSLNDINAAEIDLLILPGGDAWEKGPIEGIEKITSEVYKLDKPIAAICAATTYLGKLGILDDIKHTSNDLTYLKAIAPNYKGEKNYQKPLAITDKNIITANGVAPIEFAREIFRVIKMYDERNLEKWFQLFKHGIWQE